MKKNKKSKFWKFLRKWVLRLTVFFFASTIFVTILYKWVNPPVTPLMLIRLVDQKKAGKDLKLSKKWVRLEDMSKYMPVAVVACEDQLYLKHNGFSWSAIKRAKEHNEKHTNKRGASTISQQTAKNVFLWPQRSYLRKGLEVYFTFLIETFWSKKRIMEVYLNVIEMGDGIYGAEMASQYYFKKSVSKISKGQAALIAVCLPNPLKMKPNNLTAYRLKRQAWALQQMRWHYPLDFDKKKKERKSEKD